MYDIPSIYSRFINPDNTFGSNSSLLTLFTSFPELGSRSFNCSLLNYCSGHGICDYCNQRCLCDVGYGSAFDVVSSGSTTSFLTCSQKVCPTGKAVGDLAVSPTVAHLPAECSNQGTCNRNTGVCNCFYPFTGPACDLRKCYVYEMLFHFLIFV